MEHLSSFDQYANVERCSPTTKKTYRFHIKKFLQYCEGKPTQEKIMPYLNNLNKYKPSSLNIAKYSIIYFFDNILNQPITIRIPQIKREEQLPRDMTQEDIYKIIDNISNLKHRALVEIAYGSGLRNSEVLHLEWSDLNLDEKVGIVRKGKGGRDGRFIIPEKVIPHLQEWREAQNPKSRYVFNSGKDDKPLTTKSFQNILKRNAKEVGLKINVYPHRLRHSFCSHLMKGGCHIRYIQKLARHKSMKTTERYLHLTDDDIKKVVSPLDAPLNYADSGI